MKQIIFEESQKNSYIFAIVPAVSTSILFGTLATVQIVSQKPIGNHPAPSSMLIAICILSLAGIVVLSIQKLRMIITEDEIYVSFGIFASAKTIRIQDIKNVKVRKYNGMSEFMGWGVKFNKKNNETCYTVSGDAGLELLCNDNKKILIGTQKEEELSLVLKKYFQNKSE